MSEDGAVSEDAAGSDRSDGRAHADGNNRSHLDRRGGSWPPWGVGAAAAGFAVGVVGAVLASSVAFAVTGDGQSLPVLAAGLLGLWAGYGATAAVVSRRTGTGRLGHDLRVRFRPRDVPIGLAAGLLSSIVVVRVVYLVLVLAGVVSTEDLARLSEPAQRVGDLGRGPGWLVLVVLVGFGAPLVEEVFYRGLVQPAVVKRLGPTAGIVVTAAVFGAAHQQPLQFPALAAFGGVLGWLAWRTGRLGPSILAHVVFNLLTLVQLALNQ